MSLPFDPEQVGFAEVVQSGGDLIAVQITFEDGSLTRYEITEELKAYLASFKPSMRRAPAFWDDPI